MSTKTTFKRIALVMVASVGMGLMSQIPAKAAILTDSTSVSATNGVAVTTNGASDTSNTTVATITVAFTGTAADTAVVTFIQDAKASGATDQVIKVYRGDVTETAAALATQTVASGTYGGDTSASTGKTTYLINPGNQVEKANTTVSTSSDTIGITAEANTRASATFSVFMDSRTGGRTAGTYTFRAVASFYSAGAGNGTLVKQTSASFNIVVSGQASESKVASATYSTAYLGSSTAELSSDAIPSASATASTTPAGYIQVKLRNASNGVAASESVTVTTTLGTVGVSGGTFGRSVVLTYSTTNDSMSIQVRPDGSVGTAVITVSTPSVTFTNKSLVFFGSMTGGSIVGTQRANSIALGSNSSAITVVAKDSSGNINGSATAILIYSDNTAVISETASACSFDSTNQRHNCTLTGLATGTAKITIGTSGKTVVSAEYTVKVTGVNADKVTLAFDKATYAPGEKGYILVKAVDSSGNALAGSITNLLAAGGIVSTSSLTSAGGGVSTSDSMSTGSVSPTLKWTTSTAGMTNLDPVYMIPFFAPQTSGTITLSATGGIALPVANRVAVTASAKVVNGAQDSADAALAAVTALATQVSAFITKINAQITTLTDLVMKIQKKVKA